MGRIARTWILALAVGSSVVGCISGIAPIIAKVIAVVSEASLWIDTIDSFADAYFAQRPAPELQRVVDDAVQRARAAAALLQAAARGTESASQEQIDAAFTEFKKAYQELIDLTRPLGVRVRGQDGPRLGVSPDRLTVPSAEDFAL